MEMRYSKFYNQKKSRVMKKQIKKATIVAMAAIAGTPVQSETQAMQAAFADMQAEYGEHAVIIDINDPFDGFCA